MLGLDKNPLNCDCIDYDIYQYVRDLGLFNFQSVRCTQPARLRGSSPVQVPLDQFVCDLHDACPLGCSCVYAPFYRNTSINCDNYKKTLLPDKVPSLAHKDHNYVLSFQHSNLIKLTHTAYLPNSTVVKLSHSHISEVTLGAFLALDNVCQLFLDNNNLKILPKNITTVRLRNATELRLGRNPWACDCQSLETKQWMVDHKDTITDKDSINCNSPENMAGRNVISIDSISFCPGYDITKYAAIIVSVLAVAVILVSGIAYCFVSKKRVWIFKKTQWHPFDRDEVADEGKEFDVFVSYANEDEGYVDEYLIPELQNRGYKVCYHRVNFCGGTSIIENICNSINNSKRTLVFFSNLFRESPFCIWEFKEALNKDLREETKNLITIKDTDLNTDDLDDTSKSYFQRFTFIEREAEGFWDNLVYSLPNRRGDPDVVENQG